MSRKTDSEEFSKACELAIEHQTYTWTFIDNLLKNKMVAHQEPKISKQLPKHGNVRGRDYYQQSPNRQSLCK